MNWEAIIIDSAATDTGMRRSNNQDSHTVVRAPSAEAWKQRGHIFLVADGMVRTPSASSPARWPAT